jgi:hypothetical protein
MNRVIHNDKTICENNAYKTYKDLTCISYTSRFVETMK